MSYRYQIGGMSVVSDVVIPGAWEVTRPAPPDVLIERGEVPEQLEAPTVIRKAWSADASRVLARSPRGRFLVSSGRTIIYQPEPGFTAEDCATYLGGSIFGFLMHQRGEVVLHASANVVAGRANLFCGPSGMGKSTLAAALCRQGHGLLTDDFCVVRFDAAGAPFVYSDARMHRLTTQALHALKPAAVGAKVNGHVSKYYVRPAATEPLEMAPLAGVYVLERGSAPSIRRLNTAEAASALFHNLYRPSLVSGLRQSEHYLGEMTRILHHVEVYGLTLSDDLALLDTTIALVESNCGLK